MHIKIKGKKDKKIINKIKQPILIVFLIISIKFLESLKITNFK